ncbi:hypothetical protein BZA70DRAFT_71265 [Myxozyma melibiosi]|uniref:TPR-like protein n=1 Tax=Myxozyma melibiosi TaxID=54550 RepID=A0ABR1F1C2_9ASCO
MESQDQYRNGDSAEASYDSKDAEFTDAPYASQANVIDIPLRDDQEVVTLNLDEDLPDDPTELCDLLENEEAGRQFWLAIGTAYSRFGKIDEAIEVIQRGLKAPSIVRAPQEERVPFNACLAWLYFKQLREAPKTVTSKVLLASQPHTKDHYQMLATKELNKTVEAYPTWSVNLLGRGILTLLRTSGKDAVDASNKYFEATLKSSGSENLMAFFGRARYLYAKENYKGALKIYQQILMYRQDIRPDPRIGIGLCFWQLGFKDEAKIAWERSLELDPNNPNTNILMGLFYQDRAFQNVTSPEFVDLYGTSLQYTQKAFKNGSQKLAIAGVELARYLFSKKTEMEKVIKLCEKVIDYAEVPAITSDAYFWMGRAYHDLGKYQEAMSSFQKARVAKPDNVLAKIGMGQIQIINNDLTEAKLTFEKIIQEHPKCAEGLLILGYLYARDHVQHASVVGSINRNDAKLAASEKAKARILLERYLNLVESRPGISDTEIDVHITLSMLYESENINQAITSLEHAMALQRQITEGGIVDPRLLNNMGVLRYHKGSYEEARELFQSGLSQITSEEFKAENRESLLVTMTYNLARLEEQTGNVEEAKTLYQEIDERMSGYVDARIRLCYLAIAEAEETQNKSILEEAVAMMQQLIESEVGNLEVRALHGWYLHQYQRKRPVAKSINEDTEFRHHRHTLQNYDKHDVYSLTAMGNVHLTIAREMRPSNEAEAEKRRKMYEKAVEFFDKSLQLDGQNAYAAQGIAIALAEDRKFNKAVGIFGKIRETLKDVSAYINLGHCLTELKNYARAIECYETALEQFQGGKSIQTMMCLGRVWLQRGINELSIESVENAIKYTERALALSPSNLALKFNIAFCHFQLAEVLRRVNINDRKVSAIETAIEGLERAITILTELAGEKNPPYPAAEIQQRATMGQNTTRRQLERLLNEQKEYEEKSEAKLEAARKAREKGNSNGQVSSSISAASVDTMA